MWLMLKDPGSTKCPCSLLSSLPLSYVPGWSLTTLPMEQHPMVTLSASQGCQLRTRLSASASLGSIKAGPQTHHSTMLPHNDWPLHENLEFPEKG